jgi:ketosteroid isomerase-like protein
MAIIRKTRARALSTWICLLAFQTAWSASPNTTFERIDGDMSNADSADIELLEGLHQRWNLAVNGSDIEGILAVLDEKIELIPPDAPELVGKLAFRRMLDEAVGSNSFRIEVLAPVEIRVDGDIAWSRYNYLIHRTPNDGTSTFTSERRYLDVFRRQADGTWRVLKHIWNYPDSNATP